MTTPIPSITDIVFKTLSRHFELTTNGVYKHCAGQPGITNMKTVRNALDRLRRQGCATCYRCEERGIYLWQAVKPIQQAVDPTEESLDTVDDQSADASNMMGEMASDVAELEQPVVNGSLTTEAADTSSLDVAVEFKPATLASTDPLGFADIIDAFELERPDGYISDLKLFAAGVAFAEKYHGISQ